jgi:hypothetical protein
MAAELLTLKNLPEDQLATCRLLMLNMHGLEN